MLTETQPYLAPDVVPSLKKREALRYIAALFLIPFLGYIGAFVVERLALWPNLTLSRWGHILDYDYKVHDQDADVVIFGDSSALYGVDIVRLSQQLHRKVINIPNTLGSLPVTRDEPLQRYLRTNRPPQLIVFYFIPWDLNAGNENNVFVYEGEEMLFRHGTWRQAWDYARRRPSEVLLFPLRFYASSLQVRAALLPHHALKIPVTLGHVELEDHRPLRNTCSIPADFSRLRNNAFIRSLVKTFTSGSTETLVYMAPIPGCAHATNFAQGPYSELGATPPGVLPPSDFADDSRYAHALPGAVPAITDLLAQSVRAKIGSDQASKTR